MLWFIFLHSPKAADVGINEEVVAQLIIGGGDDAFFGRKNVVVDVAAFHRAKTFKSCGRFFLCARRQSGKKFVAENRFFGRNATESAIEFSGPLSQEGSLHLEEAIGEARLKNAAGYRGKEP